MDDISNFDNGQKPTEWYYELKGNRIGPVSADEIKNLLSSKALNNNSPIWKKDFKDWKQIWETELKDYSEFLHPALTDEKVNNLFIWILAFTPIIGSLLIELFLPANLNNFTSNFIIFFILNTLLAALDDTRLNKAGYESNNLVWAITIVPVYIWRRAVLTKQSKAYFWIYIVSLFTSVFIFNNGDSFQQFTQGLKEGVSEYNTEKNYTTAPSIIQSQNTFKLDTTIKGRGDKAIYLNLPERLVTFNITTSDSDALLIFGQIYSLDGTLLDQTGVCNANNPIEDAIMILQPTKYLIQIHATGSFKLRVY